MTGWNLSPSAICLLLLFGVAAYGGAELIAFQRLADHATADIAAKRVAYRTNGLTKPFVSIWSDVTGAATQARRLALKIVLAETPGDTAAVEEALSEIAEASPT